MSIIQSLKKLTDPIRARDEAAEVKRQQEQPIRASPAEPPLYRCRVCGTEGCDSGYCPVCLADTMVPIRH